MGLAHSYILKEYSLLPYGDAVVMVRVDTMALFIRNRLAKFVRKRVRSKECKECSRIPGKRDTSMIVK